MLNKKLPDAELKIMKYIWNTGYKTVISKDVADEIEKTYGWKHTTTITLLARLTKKGFLISQRIGKHVHYTVLVKEREYLKLEGKRIFGGLHNNPLSQLISKLHDKEEVSIDKIDALEKWLRSLQEDEE
ncbi:BlaI/MecI/CopY family transcriptional regulator [Clostridioides difficile]|uniref:BlaI/MecI/CopY family transcriptional regulator n=4 Tax=Clostridioides difficile TaxID=1496 RepID=UPI000944D02F|nr:BlaI/MecI/CopY family transcriptional regulator [Clostridioides difficile]MBH7846812.1 BlaI/MecI/CopY family transcriptional regulator [Clostridioides difficile]MBJ9770501.1 BlaI/MecI/CopY family transcriptional regulator [Clostridioides difficile]MBY1606872.1 BlaI/MecI/CopY family transcriptional regulator [Clostridioides difficile]MBY1715160.1 BlaI/MecI/CopY family transcriptional regulator [Clostridioides difficile]MBZ0644577.1 BlaI/MecI/CopY family transcriptional regulator [Clostridioi